MRRPLAVLGLTGAIAALVWWAIPPGDASPVAERAVSGKAPPTAPERVARRPSASSPPQPPAAPALPEQIPGARAGERELWTLRLQRAERTLEEYRRATRYPPESRPAAEHPDQMEPAAPERRLPFEEGDASLFLVARQDRVFVSGEEAVTLTLRCEDRQGAPQRCAILPATAQEPPHEGTPPLAPVPVIFNDAGREGDPVARDDTYTARFAPGRAGFLGSGGTIRIAVAAAAGAERRDAFFDVLYTGIPPATFTGKIRDRLEGGSLQLEVGLTVKKPGRYVITGRVDDAAGRPFAWLQFNEELPAGAQVARLTVFGKLIVDERPAFPLRLRDVEGFLLKEQGDPDRELMPAMAGAVHATAPHPLERFSDAEWSSEQRDRYLAELEKDVDEASDALAAAAGP